MASGKKKKKMNKIIWGLILLVIIGAFGIPKLYHNYHTAPYYSFSDQKITLENHDTHKLNGYQKEQFLKIARGAIDSEDGPFDWKNYEDVSLSVYKMGKPAEYGLIYKIKPKIRSKKSIVTNSMIIKLKSRNLINHYDITIKKYSSDFSDPLNSGK